MKKHELMNLCLPVFNQLKTLQSSDSKNLPEDFGDRLYQTLLNFEHLGFEHQIPTHQSSEAKYALAALLDEAMMRSEWPGKSSWMDQSLQLRLFGEHLAGVHFFDRLARIRQSGELNIPVLEVFFVCLQLGFQGKYAMSQQEELKALQVDIKHQLDLYQGVFDSSLSVEHVDGGALAAPVKRKMPEWAWVGVFGLTLGLLYSVYGFRFKSLHDQHQTLVEQAISQVNVY
jgi:type VI secretion system protein ImpK